MASIKDYLSELRIQNAYKNLLILLASFFGGKLFITSNYPNLALGFLALSLSSSACYIINDIKDAPSTLTIQRRSKGPSLVEK